VATVTHDVPERETGPLTRRLMAEGLKVKARFVRVHAVNIGRIPAWHHAGGIKAWLFVDEILVNPKSEREAAFDALMSYKFGAPRRPLTTFEELVKRSAPGSKVRAKLRKQLAFVLVSPKSTSAGKQFVCRMLAQIGTDEEVPALATMLCDPTTAEAARFALTRMSTPAAVAALRTSLTKTRGRTLCGVIGSLGTLRDARSVDALSAFVTDADPAVAVGAVRALGRIGGRASAERLTRALDVKAPGVAAALPDAGLECAASLAAAGDRTAARSLYQTVYRKSADPVVRMDAVGGLAELGDRPSMATLIEALNDEDAGVRKVAASFVRETRNAEIIDLLISDFPKFSLETKSLVLEILADRGETGALPAIVQACEDHDPGVRLAAIGALGRVADRSAVPVLCRALYPKRPQSERAAAESGLCQLRGNGVNDAILAAMKPAVPAIRAILIRCLGKRRATSTVSRILEAASDANAPVRIAAFRALSVLARPGDMPVLVNRMLQVEDGAEYREAAKAVVALSRRIRPDSGPAQAVLGALASPVNATPERKTRLLTVLGRIGDVRAESALLTALRDPRGGDVQAAAIEALSHWSDDAPIDPLLGVARAAVDAKSRVLALRAALELTARRVDKRPSLATLDFLKKAMAAATRDAERKRILGAAAKVPCVEGLDLVVPYVATPSLTGEAVAAILAIAEKVKTTHPDKVQAALDAVLQHTKDEDVRKSAGRILGDVAKRVPDAALRKRLEQTPWQALFNGKDLQGWRIVRGGPKAWTAVHGILRANKGASGWIATTREHTDYLIEFEFRLPPGGNSGLFLRAPFEGNPAFAGMEVQILDDYAPQYEHLQPAQYCASVYGIAAASPRVSKHAGEWQRLAVLCAGRLVRVHLNGMLVATANLDDHLDKTGRIPGIKRTRGHIGLQNEHGPIEFRNIRIKDIRLASK